MSTASDMRIKGESDSGMKRSSGREWLSQKSNDGAPALNRFVDAVPCGREMVAVHSISGALGEVERL
ncbi:uncharacterized protein LAESUDRAFT_725725 [Laetiporus sulphureus 93-53]|uniref:Uncharacterized protein n=1 Tax=Laetiporus sulphureus 93-53 TaxID=1314785 RepID=A0A165EB18_9APHY|nr:uncharacterized protein LAESUDRAFT_725725 [Laetiporus sulphureus 93-53]KZT06632.1 hypothetical protein LAESUDRAFT_725725 [Laetiporus sulphureus 93-53]